MSGINHLILGLPIPPATNLVTSSSDLTNVTYWDKVSGGNSPTITSSGQSDPYGGTTACLLHFPSVSAGFGLLNTSNPPTQSNGSKYIGSIYFKGNAGGETIYLAATPDGVTYVRQLATLTTGWQRFDISWTAGASAYYFQVGTDLRDGSQSTRPAADIYVAFPMVELVTWQTNPSRYVAT